MPTVYSPAVSARRDLWLIRLYYFMWIGASGFLLPFLSLYYRRVGLSGAQIGLLGTVQAVVGLVAGPAWGRWSDRVQRPRRLLQVALLATAVIALLLGRQSMFGVIALLVAVDALFTAGMTPLADILAATLAERAGGAGFGSVRLWGSLGWTLVTAVAGTLVQWAGLYLAFVGYAVGMISSAFTVQFVPTPPPEPGEPDGPPQVSLGAIARTIGRNRRLVGLAAALGVSWLLSSSLYQFEAIFLDELGAEEALIGVANAINAAVELPAMLWADRVLKRRSPGWLLRAGFLAMGIRAMTILLFPTIPAIMLMRVVIGLQFSFYSVGIVAFINKHAARSLRVTTLALMTITLRNLVAMVGSPVSGLVYDLVGAYWLYALALAGAGAGWLALFWSRRRDLAADNGR